jgi:hypothetical protein
MIIDRYTKVILTVIAGCLLFNIVRDTSVIRQAFAQSGQVHVVVDEVGAYAFQYTLPLNVHCTDGCK